MPLRSGPPAGAGRWSLVTGRSEDQTRRTHALAEQLLNRHGIVTPGIVNVERVPGGFSAVYTVLKAMEEAGRCRRGYFVEGLGGAQFALLRERWTGCALSPTSRGETCRPKSSPRPIPPIRTALPFRGPSVMVVIGLVGKPARSWSWWAAASRSMSNEADALFCPTPTILEDLQPAVDALALAARDGMLGKLSVERADGADVLDTPFAKALVHAGFRPSSRGLRLRA